MDSNYVEQTLKAQSERLRLEAFQIESKIAEIHNYLNGNPHNAILCSYYEFGDEGGFAYRNSLDFTYVGKRILTKYGDGLTVESYDPTTDLIHFVEDHKPLDPSRISIVDLDEESYQACCERRAEFYRENPDLIDYDKKSVTMES